MAKAAVMVTAPATRRPAPFGVATVADVQTSDAPWAFGGAQVEVDVCATELQRAVEECLPPDPQGPTNEVVHATVSGGVTPQAVTPGLDVTVNATGTQVAARVDKTSTPTYGGIIEADPFHLYLLDGCKTVGRWSAAEARVRRAFEAAESAGVDGAVIADVLAGADALTAADCLAAAIGAAEEHAADAGWGLPILLLPRAFAPAAFRHNLLVRSGDHLETQTGSLVALVSNESQGVNGVLGIVPWLVLLQGSLVISGPTVDMVTNEFVVLAERSYLALFPCAASIEFALDDLCGAGAVTP